eukprot:7102164-Pyramimonas_sp.AAC.1
MKCAAGPYHQWTDDERLNREAMSLLLQGGWSRLGFTGHVKAQMGQIVQEMQAAGWNADLLSLGAISEKLLIGLMQPWKQVSLES